MALGTLLQRLQTKLAGNSAWQSWQGISTSSTARIYLHRAPKDADAPYMEITWAPQTRISSAHLSGDDNELEGALLVSIVNKTADSVDEDDDIDFTYLDNCTEILKELVNDATDFQNLPIRFAELIGGPKRTEKHRREADGDWMISVWMLDLMGTAL